MRQPRCRRLQRQQQGLQPQPTHSDAPGLIARQRTQGNALTERTTTVNPILAHPSDTRQDVGSPKTRGGRKRHGYRPHRANDRRGSGTSTLASSERTARNRVRAQLRAVRLTPRAV